MRRTLAIIAGLVFTGLLLSPETTSRSSTTASRPAAKQQSSPIGFATHVRPFFEKYCFACHSSKVKTAGFDLQGLVEAYPQSLVKSYRQWELVSQQIYSLTMPPSVIPQQPSATERKTVPSWIDARLETTDLTRFNDPGEKPARRLTRFEFQNTIRSLTKLDLDLGRYLPVEAVSEEGLPNNGNNLFFTPQHLEKLFQASDDLMQHATFSPTLGMQFHLEPPLAIRHEEKLREASTKLASLYFRVVHSEIEEDGAAIPRYFVAAWELRNAGGAPSRERLDFVARQHRVNGQALQRLLGYLTQDYLSLVSEPGKTDKTLVREFVEFRPHFEPLFQLFQSLPVAHDSREKILALPRVQAAAREFGDLVRKLSASVDYTYTLNDADHSYPFDIDVSKAEAVYLAAVPATSGANDYTAWLDGVFHFADGSERSLAQCAQIEGNSADGHVAENANSRGKPLHSFTVASLSDVARKLYADPASMNRSNPQYRDNTIAWNQAYAVKAPSLLAFRVPSGATRFTVRGAMQDISRSLPGDKRWEWWEGGMAQFFVTTARPAQLKIIPGARVTFSSGLQLPQGAAGQYLAVAEKLFTPFFPSMGQWVISATENPGQAGGTGIFYPPVEQLAALLPVRTAESRKELLRLYKEYMLLSAEPTFVKGQISAILNAERRVIQRNFKDHVLTDAEVRIHGGAPVKQQVTKLDALLSNQNGLRAAVQHQLGDFAARVFRRPVTTGEVDAVMRLYDGYMAGGKAESEEAAKFAATSLFTSPSFLYISEKASSADHPALLTGFEMANRLSYFLWSTMPDEKSLALAKIGSLDDPARLWKEAERMLRDERSVALADQFFGYAFGFGRIRRYDEVNADLFPEFTPSLREAMYQEPLRFSHDMLRNDRSILNLVDSDYTFLNQELARHYGIKGVEGPDFRRVTIGRTERGGILGMAAVLTLTSKPARTSPTVRGLFVLRDVLGTPPSPPPPDVNAQLDKVSSETGAPLNVRQQLEKHRTKPACAACHRTIDSVGFTLENFDPIGRYRTKDAATGEAIDTRSTLPNGTAVASFPELKQILLTGREKKKFVQAFCRQLLSYALGRTLTYNDLGTERAMILAMEQNGYRFSAAVRVIVESRQFRYKPANGMLSRANHSGTEFRTGGIQK